MWQMESHSVRCYDDMYLNDWQILLPLWQMEWPHLSLADVIATVADEIATWIG